MRKHRIGNDFDSRAVLVVCEEKGEKTYYYYNDKAQECYFCGAPIIVDMDITVQEVWDEDPHHGV